MDAIDLNSPRGEDSSSEARRTPRITARPDGALWRPWMRAERPLWRVVPDPSSRRPVRITRIVDPVVRIALVPLPYDEEPDRAFCVVDERVRDAGAGRKGYAIAWAKSMKMAVNPDVRIALNYEDKLLFHAMRVGP